MTGERRLIIAIQICLYSVGVILLILGGSLVILFNPHFNATLPAEGSAQANIIKSSYWIPPDTAAIPQTAVGELVRYGYHLVAHTSIFLGPKGKVAAISNGMNCQNCHLNAGTKLYGNNYSAVASTYPKFRARSGTIESVEKRVNDCIERSLNGKPLDPSSREMQAFVAYIKWVGSHVPKDSVPEGAGLVNLPPLKRPADVVKGKLVFQHHCIRCHGENGGGMLAENKLEWKYPPLYGDNSYNIGAGLYRLSRFAGYVKANMPNDLATYQNPLLSDEEAWDVAAYVNSMPRPAKDISKDWPDISAKPFDHPFGPYADTFSTSQHKYGPYIGMKMK